MSIRSVAIVGLGQIGGSLVLALRKARVDCTITGIDPSRKRRQLLAPQLDESSASWKAASSADFVIICLHFKKVIEFLERYRHANLLMDVCSGKQKIVSVANDRRLRFVGGHPLAGNERRADKGWDENLFASAPFFLCRSAASSGADLRKIKALLRKIGAKPIEVDPRVHDRYMAEASHFPAFVSRLLLQLSPELPQTFQGPGYKSMTRLAHSPPELLETFLQSNSRNIKVCAIRLQRELQRWVRTELNQHKVTKNTKKRTKTRA